MEDRMRSTIQAMVKNQTIILSDMRSPGERKESLYTFQKDHFGSWVERTLQESKDRNWESSWEATVIILARVNSGLEQGGRKRVVAS